MNVLPVILAIMLLLGVTIAVPVQTALQSVEPSAHPIFPGDIGIDEILPSAHPIFPGDFDTDLPMATTEEHQL